MDLSAITLARETEDVVELCHIASLQVVPKDDLIADQIVHGEPVQLHQLARVPGLLRSVERNRLEELRAVYSELPSIRSERHGNPLSDKGVADGVGEEVRPPMVTHRDHLLDDHVRLSFVLQAPSRREGGEVELTFHVEPVHQGQEFLGRVVKLVLPVVRLFQVQEDLLPSGCSHIIDCYRGLGSIEDQSIHPSMDTCR